MSHANAPLTPEGRLRLIERCGHRPIAHVAAEAGVSRACLSKWKARFDADGLSGLADRPSAPYSRPTITAPEVVDLIEAFRRDGHMTARAIRRELAARGHDVSLAMVSRWLQRLGISRLRDLDPDGSTNRHVGRIVARFPGHMVHLDVKKVGRIPNGGGHRARAFFAAHGITRIVRVITDNGSNYRAKTFARTVAGTASRYQRTRPYTPRHNGKVERYNRILANELLYA